MRLTPLSAVTALVLLFASSVAAGSDAADRIEALNAKWLAMVEAGDAAGIAALYAPDGRLMPPGAPTAEGREAIEKVWAGFLELPSLTFGSHGIRVAEAGDMAYDTGWIAMEMRGDDGALRSARGKYVVIWEQGADGWQVAVDILNMD